MLDIKNLIELAKATAKADRNTPVAYSFEGKNFSYDQLQSTLRDELNALVGTPQLYRENKNKLFTLVEQTIDEVLPQKVMQQYSQFAEIKTFAQGEKPVFVQRISEASRRRAKQFVTRVGLAGVYEVFKLDGKSYEVQTSAYGGAAYLPFEEFLDGRIDWSEIINVILEGLDETIYTEIEKALRGSVDSIQAANKFVGAGFQEIQMDKLLTVADSYGGPATIYCTFEFAASMLPADTSTWSNDMKDQKWNNGYFARYKGHPVIVLPQSFTDETNTTKVVDPSYAYIIPTGGNDKPVKIAFEGAAQSRDLDNQDWSKEFRTYKKFGVAALMTPNICVYRNTSLT